jgi:transcriptional regulator
VLETMHHAAAAESDLHFVNDDENAMTAAPLLQRLKEPHRWHDDAAIRHQRFDEALISLELFLKRSVTGTAMRAAAEDFNVVRLMGIPASRIIATAFLLSGLLAGIASMLWIAQHASVDPLMGFTPVLKAFIAAVVGGLGSLRGAVAGGFLLGISEVLLQATLPPELAPYRDAIVLSGVKPEYAPLTQDEVFSLIEKTAFATVVTHGLSGLVASHLPFVLNRQESGEAALVSHLARANPYSALIAAGHDTIVIFQGPHRYISSSWYPAQPGRDSAPTWNFAVVHCHGKPQVLDDNGTARHLLELVDVLEDGRDDRWRMRELGPGGMERRMPQILGFSLPVTRMEAKFKMGQDERFYDTNAAIVALDDSNPAL